MEQRFLKDYKPLPNENKPQRIRQLLNQTHYFLRLDDLSCDSLFFIEDGNVLVNAGTMSLLERAGDKTAYSVVFGSRDAQGKQQVEHATLTLDLKRKDLVLEFPDRKFHFSPEPRKPEDLATAYGKPNLTTNLAEY